MVCFSYPIWCEDVFEIKNYDRKLTIFHYFCVYLRFILEHANCPYEHISDMPSMAAQCSAFGGSAASTFAPPIVKDGDVCLSQTAAVNLHIGTKLGFDKGVPSPAHGVMLMMNMIDFFEGGISTAASKGGKDLKAFLEGERVQKWIGNLERSIVGPFHYGDSPTYVDFMLCALMDWTDATILNRLKAEKGVDLFSGSSAAKIMGVVNGVRSLESYKNYSGGLETMRPGFELKDAVVADYC